MNTNATPVVAQSVTVVRPSSSFDCSNMMYAITKVATVIILSSFGGGLLIFGVVLYTVESFFQTAAIIMIVIGMGLITIAIIICAKGNPCRGNSSGRIIQRDNATPQVVTQPLPATVQYPATGYMAVTSQTYSPGLAGQAAAPSAFPAPAGGFSANYTYTSGDGKGPLPAYPASTAGTYPLGQNQGDAYPPGQHPPGLYSPGVYQPGAPPAGPYQPGALPAGPYPPSYTSAPPAVPNLTAPEYQPPPPFAPTEKPPPYSY